MSASRSLIGLLIVMLAIFTAILASDSGGIVPVHRELLILGLLAAAGLAVQSALAWRAARRQATPFIFVREGTVRRSIGQVSAANDRLRPVSLAVESGQAVVVERNGLFSRVLGPGLSTLLPGETVYKVISTQPRTLIGNVSCTTRDGITVTLDFEVSAQIMPRAAGGASWGSPQEAATAATSLALPSAEPRWSEDALVRAAYETHTWESAVLSLARSSLREQLARSYVSDVHLPAVSPQGTTSLESLQSRCRRRMTASSSLLGISIQHFQIVHLGVPPELASGNVSAGRARRPDEHLAPSPLEDETSSVQSWTAIRLASVLGGGPFVTFRQAMRGCVGEVTIPDVLLEGHRWVGRALGQTDPVPYELLPDRIHYDIQVHGRNFLPAGLHDGDHLLFASRPEPADGDIVAVVVDGQLELRRYWQKVDHALLDPERESQPPVAVVANDQLLASLKARYSGGPPIEIRPATAVKVLGRAAIAFQPQSAASRSAPDHLTLTMEHRSDPDSPASGVSSAEAQPDGTDPDT